MSSSPIISWEIDGETVETVSDLFWEGSKITADGDWSHKIKGCLLLGRKAMTNLDSVLKQWHHFAYKGPYNQSYGFSMYGCETWTIKKAEHQRIDAFKLWCWRRLLRVPWTAKRSNQAVLKDINPEYSLEGLMLKTKFQYFWPSNEKSGLTGKNPVGKDWKQKDKGTTEVEMVR